MALAMDHDQRMPREVRPTENLARAAAAILRTNRPLSAEFRDQVAQMVAALDECVSNLSMTEQAHKLAGQPFYSKGLEMARAALAHTTAQEAKS